MKYFDEIQQLIIEIANGNFDVDISSIPEENNEEYAVASGIKMLGEELSQKTVSKEHFEKLFNTFIFLVFITCKNGNIILLNKPARELLKILKTNTTNLFEFLPNLKNFILNNEEPSLEIDINVNKNTYYFNIINHELNFRGDEQHLILFEDITNRLLLEQELLKLQINTTEKERERIAKDIHDSIGQKLTALKMNYSLLTSKHKNSLSPELIKDFENCKAIIDETITELRQICLDIKPAGFEISTLPELIEELIVEPYNKTKTSPTILFFVKGKRKKLSLELKTSIFRIVQEFISNSVKHTEANEINIFLSFTPYSLIVELSDNGKGFNIEEKLKSPNNHGLKNIVSRIKSINGFYHFKSKKNKGTSLIIKVPLNNKNTNK